MSNLTGTVISATTSTQAKSQAGKSYEAWEIVFKGQDGKVQSLTKHVNGFKFNPDLKAAIESLGPGDKFVATMEKNDKGFNDVTSIVKGEFASSMPDAPKTGKVTGSNYETKEERAARQRLIVRQSSLTAAMAALGVGAGEAGDVSEILELADKFTDWVFENNKPEAEVE